MVATDGFRAADRGGRYCPPGTRQEGGGQVVGNKAEGGTPGSREVGLGLQGPVGRTQAGGRHSPYVQGRGTAGL